MIGDRTLFKLVLIIKVVEKHFHDHWEVYPSARGLTFSVAIGASWLWVSKTTWERIIISVFCVFAFSHFIIMLAKEEGIGARNTKGMG